MKLADRTALANPPYAGLDKMKEGVYDVVFMDLDMPVMNGLEATRKLREWEDIHRPLARQPICALTSAVLGEVDKKKLVELREAGLDVFESKPANIPRLLRVVDDVSAMFSGLTLNQVVGASEGGDANMRLSCL